MNSLFEKFFACRGLVAIASFDPTEYRITTYTHEYLGMIIHQDDFMITFQNQKKKVVKILKSNINQISVLLSFKNYADPTRNAQPHK
ncbi:MAG: hypothetical protein JNM78_05140 [Cyclobacteriaceae bacterium]|nr:hypothetical protein [Cyclobacteriaceae bacterium]